ncbi:DUF3772 domain-containing protein [Gluconobacter sphaericus]|uniref:DUF3772 domain-containing protein n=1 Tax=Gluconobacter sphaericus TaxID=574987 RepID=UPI001B8C28A0|nr:DUF3772 domain-containing protein [Gluconobacter sphaericus]MBS1096978.1 DUF3772 domain-containing protein [Gluconobacter sphaericus]
MNTRPPARDFSNLRTLRPGTTCGSMLSALFLVFGLLYAGVTTPPALAAAAQTAAAPTKDAPKDADKTQQSDPANSGLGWNAVSASISRQLDDNAAVLQQVFATLNRKNVNTGNNELDALSAQIQKVKQNTQDAVTQIQSYDNITESFLKILGPTAAEKEDASVTAQRQQMQKNSQSVKSALMRAKLYNLQAQQLNTAINARRTRLQHAALSERTVSPLAPRFWNTLLTERAENRYSLHAGGVLSDWLYLLIGCAITFATIGLSSPLILRLLKRCGAHFRPATEDSVKEALSGSIIAITLNGALEALIATLVWFIWAAAALPDGGGPIGAIIEETLPVCGFIIGAGLPVFGRNGVLAQGNPGERKALRGVDWILAISILLLDLLRAFQAQDTFGQTLQLLLEIAFSIAIGLCAVDTFRRLGNQNDTRGFAPSALGVSSLLLAVTVISILLGYVAFAFTLNGWLLSLGTGVAIVTLLGLFWRDVLDRLFSEGGFFSLRLVQLGLTQRRLSQIGVILSGLGNVLLLLLLFSIAQTDGSFSVTDITNRLWLLFVGNTIHGVKISLDTVILAVILLVVAYYAIRQTRGWLRDRFFPTTRLDIGSRTSILSIFTYCAWILVGLGILSIAGVSVQNLTWVVSALSVGIGFGLQSIVQNFVSGVILMAERPVRVGDMVEIAGTRGDVKRISIRATDIGLSDGSTMIVPNSQFITTSVKNATLSGATGVLTLTFKIPLTTDPDKAKAMLLEVAAHRDEVLATPSPKVRVSAIAGDSLTMTLSVAIISARDGGSVQDAILFDVFRRFHAEDVAITTA